MLLTTSYSFALTSKPNVQGLSQSQQSVRITPIEIVRERIGKRYGDASEARFEHYLEYKRI